MKILDKLKSQGLQVHIEHYRHSAKDGTLIRYSRKSKGDVETKGGTTFVDIVDTDGMHYSGRADCWHEDPFNYKLGVTIAANRAVLEMKGGKY